MTSPLGGDGRALLRRRAPAHQPHVHLLGEVGHLPGQVSVLADLAGHLRVLLKKALSLARELLAVPRGDRVLGLAHILAVLVAIGLSGRRQ